MSRRVDNDDQQRLEQARMMQQKNKAAQKDGREKFNRTMTQQRAESGKANEQDKAQQGKDGVRKSAQAALLARSGIMGANKFAGMLQNKGKDNVAKTRSEVQSRDDDLRESSNEAVEQNAEANRGMRVEGDRLAAIDGERGGRGGRGGGGTGGGDSDSDGSGQGQGGLAEVQGAQQSEAAQQAQGPNAPQLPQAVLQEIIKRVMVGVDKEGMSQFVIQFKDDILGGASMHISAKGGKISAKFTTGDKNAARLLKASEGALARAFGHRGMTLERLEVEAD